jgi:hypothetical protein
MSPLSGLSSDFLQDFLTTLLRTLISSGKQKLLAVHTDKKVYDPSETVTWNALLVDQAGVPINDAVVDIKVKKASTAGNQLSVSDIQLSSTGDGSYSSVVSGLGEGKYSYLAQAKSCQADSTVRLGPPQASLASSFLGGDSGTIVVEPLNKEFVQTSMNVQLLRQVSSVTGGDFMTPSQLIHDGIHVEPEWKEPLRLSKESRFELLSSLPILAVVFVMLTIEWVMRKILGLP